MKKYKHVWFINFTGIGNGVVIASLLYCFEKSFPETDYFHTENEILSDDWFIQKAGLQKIKGASPIEWRRFKKKDWGEIINFINQNAIDLIVNLRNEGPKYDAEYYEFKEFFGSNGNLTFWDLDFGIIEKREKQENLTHDILRMFQTHGVDVSHYRSRWLSVQDDNKQGIGFGMAASQNNKRWPTHKWVELAQMILKNNIDQKLIIFYGLSQEETDQALAVQKDIGSDRVELIDRQTLSNIAIRLEKLKCFISNDTGLLHICVATGTPTIGLYTNTDPNIWAPYDKEYFLSCANIFMNKCPARKIYCGNCFHYYDACPAITQYGDDINPIQVFRLVKEIIS